jgi:hypothetical protein
MLFQVVPASSLVVDNRLGSLCVCVCVCVCIVCVCIVCVSLCFVHVCVFSILQVPICLRWVCTFPRPYLSIRRALTVATMYIDTPVQKP